MARVHIVTQTSEDLRPGYLLAALGDIWRERGHHVEVGPRLPAEADFGFLHVDLTRVPTELAAQSCRGPLINAGVLDISKRRISRQLVAPDDGWDGPVIVKTDANAFGKPERACLSTWSPLRLRQKLTKHLPWRWLHALPRNTYPILEHRDRVPAWVWRRQDLVVERFRPERVGEGYAIRIWVFFGAAEYSVRMIAPDPLVKLAGMTHYEYLDEVPAELRARRAELGMEYGKFDYVLVNGEVVLLDVNKTPSIRVTKDPSPNVFRLADALEAFLEGAR